QGVYSLRLSTLPLSTSESMTIRILAQEKQYKLDELFLFPFQCEQMKSWLKNRYGLILLTGPTGCGKSTTMYALLEFLLQSEKHQVITLEDPVEKKIEDVLQVEINESAGITYET